MLTKEEFYQEIPGVDSDKMKRIILDYPHTKFFIYPSFEIKEDYSNIDEAFVIGLYDNPKFITDFNLSDSKEGYDMSRNGIPSIDFVMALKERVSYLKQKLRDERITKYIFIMEGLEVHRVWIHVMDKLFNELHQYINNQKKEE